MFAGPHPPLDPSNTGPQRRAPAVSSCGSSPAASSRSCPAFAPVRDKEVRDLLIRPSGLRPGPRRERRQTHVEGGRALVLQIRPLVVPGCAAVFGSISHNKSNLANGGLAPGSSTRCSPEIGGKEGFSEGAVTPSKLKVPAFVDVSANALRLVPTIVHLHGFYRAEVSRDLRVGGAGNPHDARQICHGIHVPPLCGCALLE